MPSLLRARCCRIRPWPTSIMATTTIIMTMPRIAVRFMAMRTTTTVIMAMSMITVMLTTITIMAMAIATPII